MAIKGSVQMSDNFKYIFYCLNVSRSTRYRKHNRAQVGYHPSFFACASGISTGRLARACRSACGNNYNSPLCWHCRNLARKRCVYHQRRGAPNWGLGSCGEDMSYEGMVDLLNGSVRFGIFQNFFSPFEFQL